MYTREEVVAAEQVVRSMLAMHGRCDHTIEEIIKSMQRKEDPAALISAMLDRIKERDE